MSNLSTFPRAKRKKQQRLYRYLPSIPEAGQSMGQHRRAADEVFDTAEKQVFTYVKRGTSSDVVHDRLARVFRDLAGGRQAESVIGYPPQDESARLVESSDSLKQVSVRLTEVALDVGLVVKGLQRDTSEETWKSLAKVVREILQMRLLFDREPSNAARRTFLRRASELEQTVDLGAALDVIYDSVDELMRAGRFSELDRILRRVNPREYSTDILIAVLTGTLPGRSHLPSRDALRTAIEQTLRERNELEDGLLAGL